MDGNGRWAKEHGLPRTAGHKFGVERIRPIVEHSIDKGVKTLSLWAFSQDNWARPNDEVTYLFDLFVNSLQKELDELHSKGVRLRFLGSRQQLPSFVVKIMQKAEELTVINNTLSLNLVINYTGRWDITQATKSIAADVAQGLMKKDDIDSDLIASRLSASDIPDPDLFIRTSGEQRISNFFLWQLAYTELYFTKVAWPDFGVNEFEKALQNFGVRERRFGKISEQILEE